MTVLRLAARRAYRLLGFAVHYLGILVHANVVVAREVVTPGSGLAPDVVVVPLRSRTWFEIASISNLINLTPGTLCLGVRREPPALVVHGMHAADPDEFRDMLCDLELRMLVAFGRREPDDGGGP